MFDIIVSIFAAILAVVFVIGFLFFAPIMLPVCIISALIMYTMAIIWGILYLIVAFIKFLVNL